MQLAEDMGMKVERRPVPEEELLTFEEAGACGTAAVISPIERIDDVAVSYTHLDVYKRQFQIFLEELRYDFLIWKSIGQHLCR